MRRRKRAATAAKEIFPQEDISDPDLAALDSDSDVSFGYGTLAEDGSEKASEFEENELIDFIRTKPIIWNAVHTDYKNAQKKKQFTNHSQKKSMLMVRNFFSHLAN